MLIHANTRELPPRLTIFIFLLCLLDLFDGFLCDPAVKRDKVHAVLRVKTNHIYKILSPKASPDLSDNGSQNHRPEQSRSWPGILPVSFLTERPLYRHERIDP